MRPRLAVSALGGEAVLWGAIATGVSAAREAVFAAIEAGNETPE